MRKFDPEKDYYQILRVREDATQDEIDKMYRYQATKHHPDSGGNEDDMKALNEAHEILSDEETRRAYDAERKAYERSGENLHRRNEGSNESGRLRFHADLSGARSKEDFAGLFVGAAICFGLGLPFLLLVESQWMFFLWPLRILAIGLLGFGLYLAHAAFKVRQRYTMNRTGRRSRIRIVIGEAVFWLIVFASGYFIYAIFRAI